MAKKKGTYIVQTEVGDPIRWIDTDLDASGGDEYGGKMAAREAVTKADKTGKFRTVKIIDCFERKQITQAVIITEGPEPKARKPRKPKGETAPENPPAA